MKKILFIFYLICTCPVFAQPFKTGHRSTVYYDAARLMRPVFTELYYPSNSAGDNVAMYPGNIKFPVVVFGHGFLTAYSTYQWLTDSLVKNGFIVAFANTETSASPSQEQFGRDLAFLCQQIPSLSDSNTSFLFGRVLKRTAVGGHSMGGGCSFLAMTYNTGIDALFNYAAAETIPSSKAAAGTVQKPVLLLAGSNDCIVPDSNELRMYNNVPYPCKTYVNITGALHCQFCNNDFACVFGQITSGCNSSPITNLIVQQKTASLLIPFLNYYLKDSCNSKSVFETVYTNMTGVTKLRTCTAEPFTCTNVYTFTGTGNWDVPGNWLNNKIPPALLPAGTEIIIDPVVTGECILNTTQTISTGAKITVMTGKKLRVPGNLIIQ